jgi:hypothetical protein
MGFLGSPLHYSFYRPFSKNRLLYKHKFTKNIGATLPDPFLGAGRRELHAVRWLPRSKPVYGDTRARP